jgi:Domain of unknown function (DUF4170)
LHKADPAAGHAGERETHQPRETIMATTPAPKQLLHLVLGGELSNIEDVEFKDLDKVEVVGLFPNYASAYTAWKSKAQRTVDNAHMRYFIVHLHRLLDPDTDVTRHKD